jgi:hypothetical protein
VDRLTQDADGGRMVWAQQPRQIDRAGNVTGRNASLEMRVAEAALDAVLQAPIACSARSAGPCNEMPVPGSVSAGRISAISQPIPARFSATPSVIPAMPAPTIKTF